MAFTIYDATMPPMIHTLGALLKIIDKAVAQTAAENTEAATLLDARLAPDMFPFTRQIQIATDAAKGCGARLSGMQPPSFPDEEKSFPELKTRIQKTIDFLKSVEREECDGAEDRHIEIKTPNRVLEFSGRDYVNNFALPNFYFHVTTAYGLLRLRGVNIGKMDFLGG